MSALQFFDSKLFAASSLNNGLILLSSYIPGIAESAIPIDSYAVSLLGNLGLNQTLSPSDTYVG